MKNPLKPISMFTLRHYQENLPCVSLPISNARSESFPLIFFSVEMINSIFFFFFGATSSAIEDQLLNSVYKTGYHFGQTVLNKAQWRKGQIDSEI